MIAFLTSLLPETPKENEEEVIDKLCERLKNSTDIDDQLTSVLALKSLTHDYQLQVGTRGMEGLIQVIKNFQEDNELLHAALETLNGIFTVHTHDSLRNGAQFSEIFVKDISNVDLLLQACSNEDFYIRFNIIAALNKLAENCLKRLQSAVLVSPMGVSSIVLMLSDKREIIRNETLLLLKYLAKGNSDIQKIIVFDNTLEIVFGIIDEEEGSEGGIVVEDCLLLLSNLLLYNTLNQNYLRETIGVKRFCILFNLEEEKFSAQKTKNMTESMKLLQILLCETNPNHKSFQNEFSVTKIFSMLQELALIKNSTLPEVLINEARITLANMICGNQKIQDLVYENVSLINLLADDCCIRSDKLIDRGKTALILFRSLVTENSALQSRIITTDNNIRSTLMNAVTDEDYQSNNFIPNIWFSCSLLSTLIKENPECKEWLRSFRTADGTDLISLIIYRLGKVSKTESHVLLYRAYIALLANWICDDPLTVDDLLKEPANLQFFVELVSTVHGRSLPVSLTCFVLGLCVLHGHQFVKDAIKSRVGIDLFLSSLSHIKEMSFYQSKILTLNQDIALAEQGFEPGLLDCINKYFGSIFLILENIRSFFFPGADIKPAADLIVIQLENEVVQMKEQMEEMKQSHVNEVNALNVEIQSQKTRIAELELALQKETKEEELTQEIERLKSSIADREQIFHDLEKDQEEMFVYLSDQDVVILELKGENNALRERLGLEPKYVDGSTLPYPSDATKHKETFSPILEISENSFGHELETDDTLNSLATQYDGSIHEESILSFGASESFPTVEPVPRAFEGLEEEPKIVSADEISNLNNEIDNEDEIDRLVRETKFEVSSFPSSEHLTIDDIFFGEHSGSKEPEYSISETIEKNSKEDEILLI